MLPPALHFTLAFMLSLFLPGVAQAYHGDRRKAVAIGLLFYGSFLCLGPLGVYHRLQPSRWTEAGAVAVALSLMGSFLFSLVDALRVAVQIGMGRRDIEDGGGVKAAIAYVAAVGVGLWIIKNLLLAWAVRALGPAAGR